MPSRRRFLAALGASATLATAGCSALPTGSGDCVPARDPDWQIRGEFWSPPVRDGQTTYVAEGYTVTGDGTQYRVAAVEDYEGQERWVYNVVDGGAGTPLVDGDRLFVGTGSDHVLSFAAETGHLQWRYEAGGRETYGGGAWGQPATADDLVLVGVSHSDRPDPDPTNHEAYTHRLVALDREDGTERWALRADRQFFAGPVVVGDAVVAVTRRGGVVAASLTDGTERWTDDLGGEAKRPPVWTGEHVVVAAGQRVVGFDPASGERAWEATTPGTTATATDEYSVVVGGDGAVVALARDGGESRWRYDAGAPVVDVASDGARTWVLDRTGVVHRLDAGSGERGDRFRVAENPASDRCGWTHREANGIAVDGDEVYVTGPWVARFPAEA
jgi:outer membrane protein assembly factor BamB